MKPHAMFLRIGCTLPDGLSLRQKQFCETWMSRRYDAIRTRYKGPNYRQALYVVTGRLFPLRFRPYGIVGDP